MNFPGTFTLCITLRTILNFRALNYHIGQSFITIADKLCITVCPSSGTCFHLKGDVDKVIDMATDQGYSGPKTGEGVFMGGHSLGTTCADNLIQGYSFDY